MCYLIVNYRKTPQHTELYTYKGSIRSLYKSFGWILQNSKLIGVIGTVSTYLAVWGKRVNCGNTLAEIQQKLEREI